MAHVRLRVISQTSLSCWTTLEGYKAMYHRGRSYMLQEQEREKRILDGKSRMERIDSFQVTNHKQEMTIWGTIFPGVERRIHPVRIGSWGKFLLDLGRPTLIQTGTRRCAETMTVFLLIRRLVKLKPSTVDYVRLHTLGVVQNCVQVGSSASIQSGIAECRERMNWTLENLESVQVQSLQVDRAN